jgi:mono/diheme cytochrome c family protein
MRPILGLAICGVIATACGTARRREPLRVPAAMDARAARGQLVFMTNCHQCHPGGEAGLAPAINDKPFPEFLKKFQVRHGLGAMPSFSSARISDAELDDLMQYLHTLRRSTRRAGSDERKP